jgi:hypothetical protein
MTDVMEASRSDIKEVFAQRWPAGTEGCHEMTEMYHEMTEMYHEITNGYHEMTEGTMKWLRVP